MVCFPAILLIKVDLPTFGIPTIIALIEAPIFPFAISFSSLLAIIPTAFSVTSFTPFPVLLFTNTAGCPLSSKYLTHASLILSFAKSALFSTNNLGLFPIISFSTGLRLAIGILASNNSITISTCLIASPISLLALLICPWEPLDLIYILTHSYHFLSILYFQHY